MSRILITGSAEGLGRAAAETLQAAGHDVIVHARSRSRAAVLDPLAERGAAVVIGDFAERDDVLRIAEELGDEPLDAVIHNAGVWSGRAVMPVNVIAPYLLTALLTRPRRLVYLSSGSHYSGSAAALKGTDWRGRTAGSYSDSKLFVTALAAAMDRLRPGVVGNAVDPGWVPTRMGGPGAPDDLEQGHRTQEWLAVSDDAEALTTGGYWYHKARRDPHESVHDQDFQDRLIAALAAETGIRITAA